MTRYQRLEKTREQILGCQETEGLAHTSDLTPRWITVVWWVPGDQSRRVRVLVVPRETRVACFGSDGSVMEMRAGRDYPFVALLRWATDWLLGTTPPHPEGGAQ